MTDLEPTRMMLCTPTGANKHKRWFWLTGGELYWAKKNVKGSSGKGPFALSGIEEQAGGLLVLRTAGEDAIVRPLDDAAHQTWLGACRAVLEAAAAAVARAEAEAAAAAQRAEEERAAARRAAEEEAARAAAAEAQAAADAAAAAQAAEATAAAEQRAVQELESSKSIAMVSEFMQACDLTAEANERLPAQW
jgi:hypothetical protein